MTTYLEREKKEKKKLDFNIFNCHRATNTLEKRLKFLFFSFLPNPEMWRVNTQKKVKLFEWRVKKISAQNLLH